MSVVVGGEWSVSRLCRFTPKESAPGTHCMGGWMDPRAGLDELEKREFLTLPGLELRPFGRPARSQSLYRLHYLLVGCRKQTPGIADEKHQHDCHVWVYIVYFLVRVSAVYMWKCCNRENVWTARRYSRAYSSHIGARSVWTCRLASNRPQNIKSPSPQKELHDSTECH
jgi:hypothetical protein